MITIYEPNESNFIDNGLAVLEPDSCVLSLTINGAWVLELEHPYDKEFKKYRHIKKEYIIRVDNIPVIRELEAEYQLFRIYDTASTLKSVKAIAFPVAFEATYDAVIEELKTANKTATATLADISAYLTSKGVTKYTIKADYTQEGVSEPSHKGVWEDTNLIEAINGSGDNSIVNKWGGEIAYDNYNILVNGRLGADSGNEIRYGKNLLGMTYEEDTSGIITRLFPKSADGVRLSWSPTSGAPLQSYVDSAHRTDYPYTRSAFIKTDYRLVDTSYVAGEQNNNTAIATHSAQEAITAMIRSVASKMWNDITTGEKWLTKWYEPEWIKDELNDIIKTLQENLIAEWDITHPTLKNLIQNCIKEGIGWIKDEDIPEFYWEEIEEGSGYYRYTNGSRDIKSQYAYIDRRYCYFNATGIYEPWKDVSSMDWIQSKSGKAKKKYGNNQRYYAQNETVYTMGDDGEGNRQFNEYYFDSDGWWDGVSNTASSWDWHEGSGGKWWFGETDADSENEYAHDCWLYIKATDNSESKRYYFDSEGYSVSELETASDWDWREKENRDYFGSTTKSQNAVYLTNQWMKIEGEWRKFNDSSLVSANKALFNQITGLLQTAIIEKESQEEIVDGQVKALYTLLYEELVAFCQKKYTDDQIDLPAVTIDVQTTDLFKTMGYGDIHEEEVTPEGYWNCDDEWKTTGFQIQTDMGTGQGETYKNLYYKYTNGVACGCLCRFYTTDQGQGGNAGIYYGVIIISKDEHACEMVANQGGNVMATYSFEYEGETFYHNEIVYLPYFNPNYRNQVYYPEHLWVASGGSLNYLDYESAHGGSSGTYQQVLEYFLVVSGLTTKKKTLKGIHLGDDVKVLDYKHGYNIKERVVSLQYDVLKGYNTSVTIDKVQKSLSQMLNSGGSSGGGQTLVAGEGIDITNGVIGVNYLPSGNSFGGNQVVVEQVVTGGTKIADIYVNGTPFPLYGDGDTKYTAGSNIQISQQNVISATDTTYSDFAGSSHGLVPPVETQSGKYLKDDGTWGTPSGGGGGASALDDLSDVDISSPSNGQIIKYNTSTSKWENANESGGTTVIANPSGTATDELETIQIGSTIYDLPKGGETVTSIIENENNFALLDTTNQVVSWTNNYISFSTNQLYNESTDKGEAVYTVPISKDVKKIRYEIYEQNWYAESSTDNFKLCVGVKSTLDTTNFATPTDNDFITKNLHTFTQSGDTITGELSVESNADYYLYIIGNGWHCTITKLELVEGTSGASALSDLTDVNISTPTNNQILLYNSTTGKWVNGNNASGGLITPVSGFATGLKIADFLIGGSSGELHAPIRCMSLSDYNNLPSSKNSDNIIYLVYSEGGRYLDPDYNYYKDGDDETLVIRTKNEGTVNQEVYWFFNGYYKPNANDVTPPSWTSPWLPNRTSTDRVMLAQSYTDATGATANNWIGFLDPATANVKIRAWVQSKSYTTGGTFWAVLDINGAMGATGQNNPYTSPYKYIVEPPTQRIYFNGKKYAEVEEVVS